MGIQNNTGLLQDHGGNDGCRLAHGGDNEAIVSCSEFEPDSTGKQCKTCGKEKNDHSDVAKRVGQIRANLRRAAAHGRAARPRLRRGHSPDPGRGRCSEFGSRAKYSNNFVFLLFLRILVFST